MHWLTTRSHWYFEDNLGLGWSWAGQIQVCLTHDMQMDLYEMVSGYKNNYLGYMAYSSSTSSLGQTARYTPASQHYNYVDQYFARHSMYQNLAGIQGGQGQILLLSQIEETFLLAWMWAAQRDLADSAWRHTQLDDQYMIFAQGPWLKDMHVSMMHISRMHISMILDPDAHSV